MLNGETVGSGASEVCSDCKAELKPRVCRSAAGYYIGYWCNSCGPYSRESGYYPTEEIATRELHEFIARECQGHDLQFEEAYFEGV